MDYLDFDKEIEKLQLDFKVNQDSIHKMVFFYQLFLSRGDDIQTKLVDKMKDLLISPNQKTFSIVNNSLIGVYSDYERSLNRAQSILHKASIDIITPIDTYLEAFTLNHNNNIAELLRIKEAVAHAKLVLDKAQNSFFRYSYQITQIDTSYSQLLPGISNLTDVNKGKLLKYKAILNIRDHMYKYELSRYNKTTIELNEQYSSLLQLIKENEKHRINFIYTSMNKFNTFVGEYIKLMDSFRELIATFFSKEISNREINDLYCKLNGFLILEDDQQSRIPMERYMSFSEYQKTSDFQNNAYKLIKPAQNHSITLNEEEQKELIDQAISELLDESDIQLDVVARVMEAMKENSTFSKKLLDCLLEQKSQYSIKFSNLDNLYHLSNIISFITLSEDACITNRFEINFTIVFIAEKAFYLFKEDNTKIYLSALLSRNKYYGTKSFWRDFLELKLANKIDEHIQRFKNIKYLDPDSPSLFTKIGSTIGLLGNLKKESLVGKNRVHQFLKHYDQLKLDNIDMIDKIVPFELAELIKKTIPNFANFNCPSEELLDMIVELSNNYKIPKENIHFYVTYYNVCTHTIRKRLPNERKTHNMSSFRGKGIELKLKMIRLAMPYLPTADILNLLSVSKRSKEYFSKKIYKGILRRKDLELQLRLKVWHILLKTYQLRKKYNYIKILNSVEACDNKNYPEIDKDINRTNLGFKHNEAGKKGLTNILRAISKCNGPMGYCQGMNYIAEILYELTDTEEEAFILFLGFFYSTEFPIIYEKDLSKLKGFFHVFKRLITLFEPELYSFMVSNCLDVNAFAPSWFITLFVNARPHLKDEQYPIIIIRILDLFILSGWKAILKVSINLLRIYETKLMELHSEVLLNYAVNDMIKSNFFKQSNLEMFEKSYYQTSISRWLISNIESEFEQQEQRKSMEKFK